MPDEILRKSEEILDKSKCLVESTIDKAISYNNVVILAAYGGLFALLGATKDYLSHSALMVVSLSLVVSLLFFVSFTLIQIFQSSILTFNTAESLLKDAEKLNLSTGVPNDQVAKARKNISFHKKAWILLTSIAVGAGMVAAIILMSSYVDSLFNDNELLTPQDVKSEESVGEGKGVSAQ